ncbi:hypothetical protein LOK49_LG07G01856 [Camellia lanceoleosa]|uniref:Uncharacterized protein n=1 Tax=Camellia lanceoleosa TaxID=1840588 RepID=A0ACC0H218_9ERIC|nr:hypothetical protein LOK49_LG07G01856 [Camellia lanceoleosa]
MLVHESSNPYANCAWNSMNLLEELQLAVVVGDHKEVATISSILHSSATSDALKSPNRNSHHFLKHRNLLKTGHEEEEEEEEEWRKEAKTLMDDGRERRWYQICPSPIAVDNNKFKVHIIILSLECDLG